MRKITFTIIILFLVSTFVIAQANFGTSLHKTRAGKNYWYGKVESGGTGGFETLTNVPITDLGCTECHGPTDANGDPYPEPFEADCNSCHKTDFSVEVNQCLSCHSRQNAEINVHQFSDVHRDSGNDAVNECWDCHKNEDVDDMHGDGTEYNSMLEPGAIKADCENCHTTGSETAPFPDHSGYDPHQGKLHCTSCHAQSVIACYNCHFESQVEHHVKRAKQQIKDFILLVNRESDGKIHPASFQSLSYQGNTWVAFGPYAPHNITNEGRTCTDCHLNFGGSVPAIEDYNDDGIMQFATWNDTDSTLTTLTGVVPMPEDYERSFKLDFITFNGDPSSPAGTDNKNWSFVEGDWDGHQMFFATPLTKEQMDKLGFDTTWTVVDVENENVIANKFRLEQNYPNPFNPNTIIKYSVPMQSNVTLKVYDALGSEVAILVNKEKAQGTYEVEFSAKGGPAYGGDAYELPSGVYFYRLKAGEYVETKKMILLK